MISRKSVRRKRIQPTYLRDSYTRPKAGERFNQTQLYPTTRKAFKRISQIYGIPLKELTPFMKGLGIPFLVSGGYQLSTHSIRTIDFGLGLTTEHELWHALQNLLKKRKWEVYGKKGRKAFIRSLKSIKEDLSVIRKSREPTANVTQPPLFEVLRAVQPRDIGLIILGRFINPVFAASAAGSIATQTVRNFIAKGFYKRHGVDGMLLIFAFPPKKSDVIHLKAHERKLVQQGFLLERGGMTRKGMQLLRQLVPREIIIERAKGIEPEKKK